MLMTGGAVGPDEILFNKPGLVIEIVVPTPDSKSV
jgi:hypothetical protein